MKLFPALKYDLQTFRGDVFGGITSAVVGLPIALAFGVASGLGPLAGIYGATIAENLNPRAWYKLAAVPLELMSRRNPFPCCEPAPYSLLGYRLPKLGYSSGLTMKLQHTGCQSLKLSSQGPGNRTENRQQ